jgi:hypothetical protein
MSDTQTRIALEDAVIPAEIEQAITDHHRRVKKLSKLSLKAIAKNFPDYDESMLRIWLAIYKASSADMDLKADALEEIYRLSQRHPEQTLEQLAVQLQAICNIASYFVSTAPVASVD